MHSSLRQKACMTCASSKRRCDKQLPECRRCLDRDLSCVYSRPTRRQREQQQRREQQVNQQRDDIIHASQAERLHGVQTFTNPDALENSLDFAAWGEGALGLDMSLSEAMMPYILTPSASIPGMSTQGISLESSDTRDTPPPWFLQDETWVIQRVAKDADCVVDIEFELRSFVNSVDSLLRQWVKHGHNGFIHRRLYEKGMPACIQDAFTTLATYISRTSAVEEAVLQIADDRSTSLIRQRTPTAIGAQGILAQLARVQALFIYEFIQLFDGSIRVRASAEKQLPILRKWVVQMWEMVKDYRGEEGSLVHDKCAANEFEKEYDTYSDLWRKWILTESVRRTHMVVESTINVYEAMTKGWAECAGAAMVTARRGLWEADSALEWFGLSCERSPLLVPSLQPGPVLSQYEAEEFDDLVKMVWAIIVGSDRMQYWRERKSNLCSV